MWRERPGGDHNGRESQAAFQRGHRVTWRELVVREHRLAQLKRRIGFLRDDGIAPSFCANDHWYGTGTAPGLRDQIVLLVGPAARPDDPILGTDAALAVAGETLRALLPPCRGCACHRLDPVRRRPG
ncbi:MAG TPA: hypothetical protein VIL85_28515 [Thermomicrobiales bacterium]|jgi:hypothetical protein